MSSFLPAPIVGVIAITLFFLNVLIIPTLVILFGLLKYLIPIKPWMEFCTNIQNNLLPSLWIDINNLILRLVGKIQWDIAGEGTIKKNHWYFVIANHRSWTDILVVQKTFNRKIPILKFFLKQELLWMLPMGGLACWTLGFPFMKRYSKAYLKKHPEMKAKDLETMQEACEKFKIMPTSVINFLEGTRYTHEKKTARSSPYQHLLRPKAGGVAYVVNALQGYMNEIIDVTIAYSHSDPTFWNLVSGKIKKISVRYEVLTIPAELYGNYYEDAHLRKRFQHWLSDRWHKKDQLISKLLTPSEYHIT
jgi:1-acyl-sn-glycerol-3-phosphate acyltransferase